MSNKFVPYISLILLSITTILQSQHTQPPGGPSVSNQPTGRLSVIAEEPEIKEREESGKEAEERLYLEQKAKIAQKPAQKKGIRLQFINESESLVAAWVPSAPDCWYPETLLPNEKGNILRVTSDYAIYIYTSAGFFLVAQNEFSLVLYKEEITGPRASRNRMLGEILRSEGIDIVITISATGSVRFEKRK